jgi:hypothetical protein
MVSDCGVPTVWTSPRRLGDERVAHDCRSAAQSGQSVTVSRWGRVACFACPHAYSRDQRGCG